MNYRQSLAQSKALLQQKHHSQAVQAAGSVLETLLKDLYNDLLSRSSPADQKQLVEAVERVGNGQPLAKLTLGQLVGVYRAAKAHEYLQKTLGLALTFLNVNSLAPLVDIRNGAVHNNREPDAAEAAFVVNQVELILRETGRLPAASPATLPDAGDLRPWWHTAIPHRDIREGRLNLKVFAIDLAQVVEGDAVPEYKDPDLFFRQTFPTRGLRSTVAGVLRRLAGRSDGVAITQMATVFGGGKTHTLLSLHHLIKHGAALAEDPLPSVQQLLEGADLESIPAARVAAVDGAHISPSQPRVTPEGLTLHTLWGEIAYRLGDADRGPEFYEIVRRSDEDRAAPGSETLERLFAAAGPSLILLDETLSYITKATAIAVGDGYLSDQAQEFLLELTRAVSAIDNVALVLTMTSSEQEQIGEAAMRVAQEVDRATRILRRTRQAEVSAEKEELYEILKRRLFDADPEVLRAQGRNVAQAYWDYYRAHASDFPQYVQSPEYRTLMAQAYPFHPALIEILRDRWGSISGFQRTRAVLRLLALVIADLYERRQSDPIIQPCHVNLGNGKIRSELLEYVDNAGGYESAITSDIGGAEESKAPYLDRVTGGDYARYHIAAGLTTAIFMHSHSGSPGRSSAQRPQLWLATLQPGITPALAADALDKLRSRLFYLEIHEGTFRISSQPNLNQMLVSRMDDVRRDPENVRTRARAAVEEVAGRRYFSNFIFWPEDAGSVDNRRSLTLVVLDPSCAWSGDESEQAAARRFVQKVLKSAGNVPRQYKNTLAFVLPTRDGVRTVENTAVRLLALEGIHRQYRGGGLSDAQMEELNTQLDSARKGLPAAVWGAYTVLIAPSGSDAMHPQGEGPSDVEGSLALWVRQEHGIVGYRPGEHTLAERAWKRLMDEQRLLDRLDPRLISEGKGDQWRLWHEDEPRINVATLWDYFCQFSYLPMLTGADALQQTIAWGVQRGLFAYALGSADNYDTVYFRESAPSTRFAIVEGAWLLRPALAEALLRPQEETQRENEPPTPEPAPAAGTVREKAGGASAQPAPQPSSTPPTPPPATYQRVRVETPVDWQQWYDFYQAVIAPLVEAGADVDIRLHLEATGEIDANLVDLSVRESVLQFSPRAKVALEE